MNDDKDNAALSPLKRAFLAIEALQAQVATLEGRDREPIAVVGIGCRLPGDVKDPDGLFALLRADGDAISDEPPDARATYRRIREDAAPTTALMPPAGFLRQDVAAFDPQFFNIAPREAAGMDPQQRLLLEVAWEALEDAAEVTPSLRGSATGVFIGIAASDYAQLQVATRNTDLLNAHFTSGVGHSVASGRLSYWLGLQGPSISLDTACSSSLVAVHLACRSLRSGECDMAIAGGVNLILDSNLTVAFLRSGMLSPDGRCKTFAAGANGFGRAEGCGVVVLKRLSTALADGNRIHALIRGIAVNQDGASSALSAPNGPAQEAVIRAALANAGLTPQDIDYVETHGTGTELGDPIEMRALGGVFGAGRAADRRLVVGSLKTNIGHLESAAGIAGLIKTVLAVREGFIPRHLHWNVPSPHIAWDELPIDVAAQGRAWPSTSAPRRAGVSSFGFSGTNCHAVVEQAPRVERSAGCAAPPLLTVSAATEPALRELAQRYAAHLRGTAPSDTPAACCTSNIGRAHLKYRLAVLGSSGDELAEQLDAWLRQPEESAVVTGRAPAEPPCVAFAFTGQGAQYAGMGKRLYERSPVFRQAVEECRAVFRDATGQDLDDVMFDERATLLEDTAYAQPALLVLETSLAAVLIDAGIRPAVVLGHSIGEYAAACIAEVLSVPDAIRLTARRGALMQRTPPGAMLAVGSTEARVSPELRAYSDVAVAAVNGPESIVVAGGVASIAALEAHFLDCGLRTKRLAVARAFHSPLMDAIVDEFEREVRAVQLRPPRLRIVSALTGKVLTAQEATSPSYWAAHLREPVRFATAAQACGAIAPLAVEVGPRPVLAGFERAEAAPGTWVPTLRPEQADDVALSRAIATLHVAGVSVAWQRLHASPLPTRTRLPTYPFQRQRCWSDLRPAADAVEEGQTAGHPLLGHRLRSPLAAIQHEATIAAARFAYVRDHIVAGAVLVPGAALVEAARAAGERALGRRVAVEQLELAEALVLEPDEARVMQTVATPSGDAAAVEIYSRAAAPDGEWRRHASARCTIPGADPTGEPVLDVAALVSGWAETSHEEFYAALERRGLTFGPALRGLRRAWHRDCEAVAEIELPAELRDDVSCYGAYPALLDVCLQSVALVLHDDDPTALYLPIELGLCDVGEGIPVRCFVHVRVETGAPGADAVRGAIDVYDESGRRAAALAGLRFQRTTGAALRGLSSRRLERLLYSVEWQPVQSTATKHHETVAEWLERLPDDLARRARDHDAIGYERFFSELEALCVEYFAAALTELGWSTIGTAETVERVAEKLGVIGEHRRLLERMLTVLAESGRVSVQDGRWTPQPLVAARGLDARLERLVQSFPAGRAEAAMVRRCGPALARALRGACDPLELLFPAGSIEDAESLYRDSPVAAIFNSCVADVVEALVQCCGRLRILEIGAGTGGTASHVLARVGGRVDYTFTDVSSLFTSRARERFAQYACMDYRVLDIERDPAAQGLEGGQFDLVLASNVLHATADLQSTLEHVRQLLAPGGTLVALEVLAPHHWFDLTVGLTPGWWKFTDRDLRPAYCAIGAAAWRKVMHAAGFRASVVPGAPGAGVLSRQGVVIAEAPANRRVAGDWLVIGDSGGVGEGVSRALAAAGQNSRVIQAAQLGGAAARAEVAALCEARERGRRAGIVVAAALDSTGLPDVRAGVLEADLERACRAALDVAIPCAAAAERAPELWFLTRGAQAVLGNESWLAPSQAALWGLARSIDLEHPHLMLRRLDLDPSDPYEQTARVAEILLSADGERQLALRDGTLFAARLAHWRQSAAREADSAARPYRYAIRERGSIDMLERVEVERVAPAAGEVEVEVAATALNFRDILNVLGLYPGVLGPPGSEFAGVVARVGSGVVAVRPGDRVLGFAAGSFARFVLAPAAQVMRIPSGLSFEQAAAVPIAFLTAAFALLRSARLAHGDRVLIHAATGGVGLAALQIARAAGATVFATAGTPEKRKLLTSLGADYVYDSRTVDFAAAIRRDTNGAGVDVVLNSLADEFVDASFAAVADGGRFVELGKRGVYSPERVAALDRGLTYHLVDWGQTAERDPELIRSVFSEVLERLERGELRPLPCRVFPLARIHDAFRYMAQGKHIGKIVVSHAPVNEAEPLRIRPDATYVIVGGMAGIGLLTATWLVDRGARNLALVGRGEPSAASADLLRELELRGARIEIGLLDVADRSALAAFLERIRRDMPPLRGVVQSAGVLDDGVLEHQTWERFRNVLAPKAFGAQNLNELTRRDPLDFFTIYASLAGLIGSAGQANHAAANAVLDTLAAARHLDGLPAVSIDWGPWSDAGAAVRHGVLERGAARGLFALSPAEGFGVLDLALRSDVHQIGAANVDWPSFFEGHAASQPFFEALHSLPRGEQATVHEEGAPARDWLTELQSQPPAKQRSETLRFVRAQVVRLLGLAEAAVETDRPLSEMGLDSLLAVEIRNVLGKAFGLTLPATVTFDHPTIELLAKELATRRFGAPQQAAPAPADDALANIEVMSEDELDRLIGEKLQSQ